MGDHDVHVELARRSMGPTDEGSDSAEPLRADSKPRGHAGPAECIASAARHDPHPRALECAASTGAEYPHVVAGRGELLCLGGYEMS